MSEKHALEQRLGKQLEDFDIRFAALQYRAEHADPRLRVELQQRLDRLDAQRRNLEERLRVLHAAGEGEWSSLKEGLEIAYGELGRAMNDAARRFG